MNTPTNAAMRPSDANIAKAFEESCPAGDAYKSVAAAVHEKVMERARELDAAQPAQACCILSEDAPVACCKCHNPQPEQPASAVCVCPQFSCPVHTFAPSPAVSPPSVVAVSVPNGFVLVPKIPTPEMDAAGKQALSDNGVDDVDTSDALLAYQAMLDAAPSPPSS